MNWKVRMAAVPIGLACSLVSRAAQPEPGGFDISKMRPDLVAELRRAWRLAERGDSNRETAVLIVRTPDGAYASELKQDPSGYQTVTFQVRPGVVAIFHTHPNRSPAQPSPQDIHNSDRLQVPNFTLTSRGMWLYDPAARKTTLVMPFLSWLTARNWQ